MLFNSGVFLQFFAAFLLLYWLARNSLTLRNWLILGASYLSLFLLRWPALAVAALIGLLDAAVDIRGRIARMRANST